MAGERYRITLWVISNFASPEDRDKLGEYAKEYLEKMLGIGVVESVEVELVDEHPADSETPTMPAPASSRPSSTVTIVVKSEPDTGIRKKLE